MSNDDLAEYLNQEFKDKRDSGVPKPDIWIVPEKPKKDRFSRQTGF